MFDLTHYAIMLTSVGSGYETSWWVTHTSAYVKNKSLDLEVHVIARTQSQVTPTVRSYVLIKQPIIKLENTVPGHISFPTLF